MARLIKADGSSITTVLPQNGYEFSAKEIFNFVGGLPIQITLEWANDSSYGTFLFMDDEQIVSLKEINVVATNLLYKYRSDLKEFVVRGDVLITGIVENEEFSYVEGAKRLYTLHKSTSVRGRVALDKSDGRTLSTDYPVALLYDDGGRQEAKWLHGHVENEKDQAWFVPDGGNWLHDKIELVEGMIVQDEAQR